MAYRGEDHITRTWLEWEIDGRTRRLILVVETDVEMQPGEPDFSAQLLDEVRVAALAHMRADPSAIDLLRIVPTH